MYSYQARISVNSPNRPSRTLTLKLNCWKSSSSTYCQGWWIKHDFYHPLISQSSIGVPRTSIGGMQVNIWHIDVIRPYKGRKCQKETGNHWLQSPSKYVDRGTPLLSSVYLNTSCWIWNFSLDLKASDGSAPAMPSGDLRRSVRDLSICKIWWCSLSRTHYCPVRSCYTYIGPGGHLLQRPVRLAEPLLNAHPVPVGVVDVVEAVPDVEWQG